MFGMTVLSWQHKHFFHRAGFGVGPEELSVAGQNPISQLVAEAIQTATIPPVKQEPRQFGSPVLGQSLFGRENIEPGLQKIETAVSRLDRLRAAWIATMSEEQVYLREKMSLFWHGHFACQCTSEVTAQPYLDTIRQHALGSFKTLLREMAKSPAMILFLNNQQNRKDHPNENFARELMELFTMGRGTYSEQDVREGARAFTGWTSDLQGNFIFRESLHDYGVKQFLGKRGRFDGDDIIDIILQQPQTATFLATRIYRYFVNETDDPVAIAEIARQIRDQDYNLSEVMYFVFTNEFFYRPKNVGNRIKSPVELLVQLSRLLKIRFQNDHDLAFLQKALGQLLFDPPNVAGWQGGRAWINNSTLMLRLNLVRYLVSQERFDHSVATPLEAMTASESIQVIDIEYDLAPVLELFSGTPYRELENAVKHLLIVTGSSPSLARSKDFREPDFTKKLILRTLSLPEFQMS
jgi:uncharacterized protein (DUF1800 family)